MPDAPEDLNYATTILTLSGWTGSPVAVAASSPEAATETMLPPNVTLSGILGDGHEFDTPTPVVCFLVNAEGDADPPIMNGSFVIVSDVFLRGRFVPLAITPAPTLVLDFEQGFRIQVTLLDSDVQERGRGR
jgi:hypothetical protein